jgi:hypothetical protein
LAARAQNEAGPVDEGDPQFGALKRPQPVPRVYGRAQPDGLQFAIAQDVCRSRESGYLPDFFLRPGAATDNECKRKGKGGDRKACSGHAIGPRSSEYTNM